MTESGRSEGEALNNVEERGEQVVKVQTGPSQGRRRVSGTMKSSFLGVLIALVGNSLIGTSFSVMKV